MQRAIVGGEHIRARVLHLTSPLTIEVIPIWQLRRIRWGPQLSIPTVSTRSQFSSSKCSSQLLGMRGPITCFAISPRVEEAPRTSKHSPWCLELWFAPSRISAGSCDGVAGSEANVRFCHDLRPSQPRKVLKLVWDPVSRVAICRPVYSVALCEHKHATVAGSQQRRRSRDQARRGSQVCKNRAPRMREAKSSNGTIAARAGETDASGDDVFCGCLGSGLTMGPVLWVA